MKEELLRILLADLGPKYDPQRAIRYLRLLNPNGKTPAEAKLEKLLERPPEEDTPLHKIYETPFVLGEIVVAGKKTRRENPLTEYLPIHFKKTYKEQMSRWETNTRHELVQSTLVWEHFAENAEPEKDLGCPRPLGASPTTYRSELIEAKTLGAISPVQPHGKQDPKELANQIEAAKKNYGGVSQLWAGLEELNSRIEKLHSGGFLHNDLHRENMMLANENGTWKTAIIDFETTEEDERFQTLEWETACREDKRYLLEEACLIRLCRLPQEILPNGSESKLARDCEAWGKNNSKILAVKRELQARRSPEKTSLQM